MKIQFFYMGEPAGFGEAHGLEGAVFTDIGNIGGHYKETTHLDGEPLLYWLLKNLKGRWHAIEVKEDAPGAP